MPGLNQLKEFSNDIKDVGDEVKIRAQRGEKAPVVPLPEGISEEDDSDAFILGMPEIASEEPETEEVQKPSIDTTATVEVPDLDSILTPQSSDSDPDLSEFMSDVPPAEQPQAEVEIPETPLEDLDLESLLSSGSEDTADALNETDSLLSGFDTLTDPVEQTPSQTEESPVEDLFSSSLDDMLASPEEMATADEADDIPEAENLSDDFNLEDLPSDLPVESQEDVLQDASENVEDISQAGDDDAFDIADDLNADFGNSEEVIDLNADLPEDLLMDDGVGKSEANQETLAETSAEAPDFATGTGEEIPASDIGGENSGDDIFSADFDSLSDNSFTETEQPGDGLSDSGSFEVPDFDQMGDSLPSDSANEENAPDSDSSFSAESLPEMGNDDFAAFDTSALDSIDSGDGEIPDASMEVPEESFAGGEDFGDAAPEVFDTSEMEGMDFSSPSGAGEDEFPVTGEGPQNSVDDFVLDSDFTIPGFSDTETADLSKKGPVLDTVDFSKGKAARPKNTLTEEEYVQFKKNLASYPLNLRLAIEDFIAKDEFTDDAVFEIIEKILKKTSARQIATQLEKLMDVSISIPRDYEKRSFAQYEAYKQSFQYQLKNRIIPAAIAGVILCFVCLGLFKASVRFIYKPVMASINYKQGYVLLENNEFPQSEDKFKEAVSYNPVKKWFFKYAEGYRAKKQFERAANIYLSALKYFNHDLKAGCDYACMELYDRANYEKAEDIVRREILDYHINNPEGMLLLGDVFLEWAEVDEEKYELAKNQYVELIQRYGNNNLYMSRMLRYFIRTDKLRDVLVYKNYFYPNKKSLSSSDWTELSGYLLDKLYGKLSRNDEYLRSSIEDVRAMLEIAVGADTSNPVAHYNLAKYFVNTGMAPQAKSELEFALNLFGDASVRTKKNIYREINASRILGELYAGNKEYLKAQTVYTRGAELFNAEHEGTGLEGDENTGKLFADLGDIDYFISGEMDSALFNYEMATKIKNDTPSVNYRIGAIYYGKENYDDALASFLKVAESESKDINVLLAVGNTLAAKGDNFTAQSYYGDLLKILDVEKTKRKILLPQEDPDEGVIVEMYLKACNNLGVTLYNVARQTGDSRKNAEAMVRLSESMRAWDALTRNPRSMIRMEGSNLASQNSKYITHSYPEFEPAIYTEIPKILSDEKPLE